MPKSMQLAALLAVAALAGCGSAPKSSFYTLSSGAAPRQAPATAPYSVAIGAVTVPDMIDRPQFVTRTGANQVTLDEFARWAEPLKGEIPRVIADNLTRLLDGARVTAYPQNANPDIDYRVLLDVQRFDSTLGEAATLEVLWTVRPAKRDSRSGRSVAREPAGAAGYDALVEAHRRALTAVSHDIAAAVRAARGVK